MNELEDDGFNDWPDEEEQSRLLNFQVLTASAPPPVDDRYRYWGEQPPELSARCWWWLGYLADNAALTVQQLADLTSFCAGYDDSAEELGVYLWEWHHILYHVITHRIASQLDREERAKNPPPWLNLKPAGNPKFGDIANLPGATTGTIKMSGFSFQKPDWTTGDDLDG